MPNYSSCFGPENILRPLLKVRIRQLLETRIVSEGIKHRVTTKKCRGEWCTGSHGAVVRQGEQLFQSIDRAVSFSKACAHSGQNFDRKRAANRILLDLRGSY